MFHDESWKLDPDFATVQQVVFFQTLPDLKDRGLLRPKRVLVMPMYDAVLSVRDDQWWEYRSFRFVSFCGALTAKLSSLGLDVFSLQFFPSLGPDVVIPPHGLIKVFFWQRARVPDLQQVLEQFVPGTALEVFFRSDVGASNLAVPSHVKLRPLPWFSTREDYLTEVASCDLYVAPRIAEGIGMSFLEAMACGVPVLAWDGPTMNEYIIHDRNGLLFGKETRWVSKNVLNRQREQLRDDRKQWRNTYEAAIPGLLKYIFSDAPVRLRSRHPFYAALGWVKSSVRWAVGFPGKKK